jgi:hypothetical protein
VGYGLVVFGFLRALSQLSNMRAEVGVNRHFSGHVPGVFSVLNELPTTSLRFPVTPNFVYRAAGVRVRSSHR